MMKVNIIDIMNLGVRTVPIQSYTSGMSLSAETTHKIGVLDGNSFLEPKTCNTRAEKNEYIQELKDLFGSNSHIVVVETPLNGISYVVSVKESKISSSPAINEADENTIATATKIVQERYSAVQEEIVLYFGRDEEGLFVVDVA